VPEQDEPQRLADPTGADLATAKAAVLTRLWGGLAREPIPGLGPRERTGATLAVKLPDGRVLRGDADAARTFAPPPSRFTLDLDGAAQSDPAALIRALGLPGAAERLAAELDNSVANLALARALPSPAQPPTVLSASLADLEQCIVDGHPLHPCCRTRLGLTPEQVRAYAPEHRPVVALHLVAVPPARWQGTEPPLLVMHPWQREHLLDRHPWLRDTGERLPARPLMSLRTLALADNPGIHVKTAIDVQMTSAVRTVSPAAVHNGPLLSALLARCAPAGLDVMAEVGGGAAVVDGQPCRSLAHLRRELPPLAAGEVVVPFAALAAPIGGRPLAAEAVRHGFRGDPLAFHAAVLAVLVPPLVALLGLGVALEAHGQNTLLVLREGRPVRLLYRDFGGVRVSPRRLGRNGLPAPPLRGDLLTDEPAQLCAKLLAAAISTVAAQLVSVLAGEFGVAEERLWAQTAAAVRAAFAERDDPDRDAEVFFAETLPIKAMTAMRLAADPLTDIWAQVPNPLAVLA
jgi:siderophore synthetase component